MKKWPETVTKADLRIDYYRGSGAGGQKRNKTSSACRITHIPTGLFATCENHRSQHQNRAEAFRRLVKQLEPLMREAASREKIKINTERIRTYQLEANRVTDHRVPGRQWNPDKILDGDLQDMIEAVLLHEETK